MKKLAVLGAGLYNIQIYYQLKEAGYYVYALDGDANAPAAIASSEFVHLDFSDAEKLYDFCKKNHVDAIIPLNDWGTVSAANVSTRLGLRGIAEESAMCATDKGLMRDRWKRDGIPVPDYIVFSRLEEIENQIAAIGFPCVMKPTNSGGSGRGISVVRSMEELKWAYEFSAPFVRNNRFIVEQFIEGVELTIESISIEGEVHILAISDKEKPEIRTRVATSLNYPAKITENQRILVENTVKKAVKSLGIHTGMAHTEVILNGDDVRLVETGARGGGGHIFHTIIEAVSGIKIPVVLARLLCGENVQIDNVLKRGATYRFFNPDHGILREVRNVDLVRSWDDILDVGIVKQPGEEVGNLRNSMDRAGFVITAGSDREASIALADKVVETIKFIIDPIDENQ